MFEAALEKMDQFTRPLHSIARTYDGLVLPGTATFFFVNGQGVAITCKHVAEMIPAAENINATYVKFKSERDRLVHDGKFNKYLQGLAHRYKYGKETTVQLRYNFLNCFDKLEQIVCHVHPTLDLAILEFKGFNQVLSNYSFLHVGLGVHVDKIKDIFNPTPD